MSLLAVGHLVIGYRVFHKIKFIKSSYTRGVHKVPSNLPLTFKPIKKSIIVVFSELEVFSNVVICDGGGVRFRLRKPREHVSIQAVKMFYILHPCFKKLKHSVPIDIIQGQYSTPSPGVLVYCWPQCTH